jgi:predicted ATPase
MLDSVEIINLLSNLVDKSLVKAIPGWETSYRLLNPIQRFAWERLTKSGERNPLRDLHLGHYLELADRARPLVRSADQSTWWNRIDLEIDNFHA